MKLDLEIKTVGTGQQVFRFRGSKYFFKNTGFTQSPPLGQQKLHLSNKMITPQIELASIPLLSGTKQEGEGYLIATIVGWAIPQHALINWSECYSYVFCDGYYEIPWIELCLLRHPGQHIHKQYYSRHCLGILCHRWSSVWKCFTGWHCMDASVIVKFSFIATAICQDRK